MNKPAPDFQLPDQDGTVRSLKDYAGRWLVLFFYPKDDTFDCTREVCAFRDQLKAIAQFGNAAVVGVSKDSVASHKRFANKHRLNFPLLSDPSCKVIKAYKAWRTVRAYLLGGLFATRRNTYIINAKSRIVREYTDVRLEHHVAEIINDLQQLQRLVKEK